MMEELIYQAFTRLSDVKKLDFLYNYLITRDETQITSIINKVDVNIDDFEVTIKCKKLSIARNIKNNLIMEGMILLDEEYLKVTTPNNVEYIVSYLYEGNVQPICLN
jgi:hypothetical protein